MSALSLALLAAHGQQVKYVPGRTANQMATAYRGEAKTDARDAYVTAETVRHRSDLTVVEVSTALVTELRLLVAHRSDLNAYPTAGRLASAAGLVPVPRDSGRHTRRPQRLQYGRQLP